MRNKLLLPSICRSLGWIIFPMGTAWLLASYVFSYQVFPFLEYTTKKKKGDFVEPGLLFSKNFYADFNGERSILLTLISLFMIAFSRERVEDEYVLSTRLHALQVSVYLNFILVAIASMLFYSFSYVYVLQGSMYSILIIYIMVFNYNLHIKPSLSKTQTI